MGQEQSSVNSESIAVLLEKPPAAQLIVIGVDQTAASHEAAHWAMKNVVKRATDKVVMIHVRPELVASSSYATLGQAYVNISMFQDLDLAMKHRSRILLKACAQPWREKGYDIRCFSLCSNRPGEELMSRAETLKADLVVVGCGQKGPMDRWMFGSVSRTVMDHFPDKVGGVVVVKTQGQAQQPFFSAADSMIHEYM